MLTTTLHDNSNPEPPTSPHGKPVLAAEGIVKRFGETTALGGVSFDVHAGEIHALCGENGAGKSTLIKVLSGIHRGGTFEGTLRIDGAPIALHSVADAERAGISVIYQELALVPEMSVAENLFLGREPVRIGLIDWPQMELMASRAMESVGLQIDPRTRVGDLGVGSQQLIEIARALTKKSRVLILDEPTAALSDTEVRILIKLLNDLRARGVAIVYISHKLDEVFEIADRITVLRDGRSVATATIEQTSKAETIHHMVGREISELFPARSPKFGESVLRVSGLSVSPPAGSVLQLRDIAFEVLAGEVLGIGGLMGAGRSELLMHLMGAWGRRLSGTVTLAGSSAAIGSPDRAIAAGMVLVTEDRKRYGLVLENTVAFNLTLSSLGALYGGMLINEAYEQVEAIHMAETLNVKSAGQNAMVGGLSGGNQQKVVLGKALMTSPKVILLDEPTRGIDIGAKQEVYRLINRLTDSGMAVVLVSSELPELIGMSDRILMMRAGRVAREFARDHAQPGDLIAAAMGHIESTGEAGQR